MQALGLIETKGLLAAIEGADAMLKAANVNLLEKTYVGGGLVTIVVTGDVAAVKAAVEAGGAAVRNINITLLISQHVIPRPHEELSNVIVSTIPLENKETSTIVSSKNEYEKGALVESSEEDTAETLDKVNKAEFEDSEGNKFLKEKIANSLKIDLSELNNKEAIDNIVQECGLEKAIKVLEKFKVVELRNLARKYKNFGIIGRSISKAGKKLLLDEFRKYYGHN